MVARLLLILIGCHISRKGVLSNETDAKRKAGNTNWGYLALREVLSSVETAHDELQPTSLKCALCIKSFLLLWLCPDRSYQVSWATEDGRLNLAVTRSALISSFVPALSHFYRVFSILRSSIYHILCPTLLLRVVIFKFLQLSPSLPARTEARVNLPSGGIPVPSAGFGCSSQITSEMWLQSVQSSQALFPHS